MAGVSIPELGVSPAVPLAGVALVVGLSPLVTGVSVPELGVSLVVLLSDVVSASPPGVALVVGLSPLVAGVSIPELGVSPAVPLFDVAGSSPPSVTLVIGLSPLVAGVSVPDVGVSPAAPLADVAGTSPPGVTLTVGLSPSVVGWLPRSSGVAAVLRPPKVPIGSLLRPELTCGHKIALVVPIWVRQACGGKFRSISFRPSGVVIVTWLPRIFTTVPTGMWYWSPSCKPFHSIKVR